MAQTLKELIEYVDEVKPNVYSDATKVRWINEVEGMVQTEVLQMPVEGLIRYVWEDDQNTKLIVEPPHDKIYEDFLIWKIDQMIGEAERANNSGIVFNDAWSEYCRWIAMNIDPAEGAAERNLYYISAYQLAVKRGFIGTEAEWIESLRGETGETGKGFIILGKFDTLEELEEAVTDPEEGDAYFVGTTEPLDAYVWISEEWFNYGPLRGADGQDGQDGQDGISPEVSVTEITGGHRITITDEDGTHIFDVADGQDGQPGADGTDGEDGFSPTFSIEEISGGHEVSVTGAQGTQTFDVMDGADGQPGPAGQDGAPGSDGEDGFSPTVTITDITGGHRVTITDAQGAHSFNVMDGTGGGGGTSIHGQLTGRDDADQHPMSAITGLVSALGGKQATISDLATIRSGAALGATALQSFTETDPVFSASTAAGISAADVVNWNGKGTYSKPSGGIPKTDLASAVQTSLGRADTALQSFTERDPVFSASAAHGISSTDIFNWNAKGTYSKPTGGIPKSDLSSAVQESLEKADSALQSFTETDPTVPSWAKQENKPTYSKSEVGLGNVDNVQQYSASNPPPYPVTSVNGETGAVNVNAVPGGGTTGQVLKKTSGGYGWANESGGTQSTTQSITLTTGGWAASGSRFAQTVNVTGVTANTPVVLVDVALSGSDVDADDAALEAWLLVSANNVTQGAGTLTFYAATKPTINVPVNVGVC